MKFATVITIVIFLLSRPTHFYATEDLQEKLTGLKGKLDGLKTNLEALKGNLDKLKKDLDPKAKKAQEATQKNENLKNSISIEEEISKDFDYKLLDDKSEKARIYIVPDENGKTPLELVLEKGTSSNVQRIINSLEEGCSIDTDTAANILLAIQNRSDSDSDYNFRTFLGKIKSEMRDSVISDLLDKAQTEDFNDIKKSSRYADAIFHGGMIKSLKKLKDKVGIEKIKEMLTGKGRPLKDDPPLMQLQNDSVNFIEEVLNLYKDEKGHLNFTEVTNMLKSQVQEQGINVTMVAGFLVFGNIKILEYLLKNQSLEKTVNKMIIDFINPKSPSLISIFPIVKMIEELSSNPYTMIHWLVVTSDEYKTKISLFVLLAMSFAVLNKTFDQKSLSIMALNRAINQKIESADQNIIKECYQDEYLMDLLCEHTNFMIDLLSQFLDRINQLNLSETGADYEYFKKRNKELIKTIFKEDNKGRTSDAFKERILSEDSIEKFKKSPFKEIIEVNKDLLDHAHENLRSQLQSKS